MANKIKKLPIKARSHILRLLGDELIGDDRLAVFELVKNGYDADATLVKVTLDLDDDDPSIVVEDNGHGMSLSDITDKWLELGTNAKRGEQRSRSEDLQRLPLGEKGVGRLAASKLGDELTLHTRRSDNPEILVTLNWQSLIGEGDYIDDLRVAVAENPEESFFPDGTTGTRVSISTLRRAEWTRGNIRSLYRLITSLSSPFDTPDSFAVEFRVPGREAEFADMLGPEDFLDFATWKYVFSISKECGNSKDSGDTFCWSYTFHPPNWKGLDSYEDLAPHVEKLKLIPKYGKSRLSKEEKSSLVLNSEDLDGIGPITGEIYAYYRRSEVLKTSGNLTQLKNWLSDQTGVRVYRDGVRVFNYGEPQDDWLGLNAKRVNAPTARLGTASVVANINLRLEHSNSLKEKTNREGFEQGEAYEKLHRIVNSVFEDFGQRHAEDRKALDAFIKGRTPGAKTRSVDEAVGRLRKTLSGHDNFKSIKQDLDAIQEQFGLVRDVMVGAGMAGLNLAVVFHEVERSLDVLAVTANKSDDIKPIRKQIEHIRALLKIFSPLLKKNPVKNVFVKDIVEAAIEMRSVRFNHHGVVVSAPILTGEEPDFVVRGAGNLLVGALGNLLDNSIYWTRLRRESEGSNLGNPPSIQVRTFWSEKDKSGFIAVVDNGPGFTIPPDKAFEPFTSRRPGGMGLGLFFANLVMEQSGGLLTVHETDEFRDEVDVSKAYDGAAVVMRFGAR